ncbi:AMMECR1 domain-containing protein [Mycena galopus ATCC 62051]|nr:AMMECR1 domain-containing protein [Mycena galopus ATCC 62051]
MLLYLPDACGIGRYLCTPEHCFHAFNALYCALTHAPTHHSQLRQRQVLRSPLFVTWNTRCIGSFDLLTLHDGLPEFALINAFYDHRFRKIEPSELEGLECEPPSLLYLVSLLTDFEDAASYLDWTVGVYGISITFGHPSLLASNSESSAPSPLSSATHLPRVTSRQTFTATYLPDAIPEQGWDKLEAITEDLCRYQSKMCVVRWDKYIEWREQQTAAS